MFKTIVTLMRGSAAAAAEDLADRNALLILDQQMRDAQGGLHTAQRALAAALAEDGQEARSGAAIAGRISGLEARARAALAADHVDLAAEAAEAIAALETELDAGRQARALFTGEIARLRRSVDGSQQRLAALERGRRVARVAEAVRISRRGRIQAVGPNQCALSEAEATLARLRDRQTLTAAAEDALDGITGGTGHQSVEERLGAAGFGPAAHSTAASVLARLKRSTNPQGAQS